MDSSHFSQVSTSCGASTSVDGSRWSTREARVWLARSSSSRLLTGGWGEDEADDDEEFVLDDDDDVAEADADTGFFGGRYRPKTLMAQSFNESGTSRRKDGSSSTNFRITSSNAWFSLS